MASNHHVNFRSLNILQTRPEILAYITAAGIRMHVSGRQKCTEPCLAVLIGDLPCCIHYRAVDRWVTKVRATAGTCARRTGARIIENDPPDRIGSAGMQLGRTDIGFHAFVGALQARFTDDIACSRDTVNIEECDHVGFD